MLNHLLTYLQRKPLVLVLVCLSVVYISLSSNSNGRATQGNRGNTGAPGEPTCGQCHSATTYGNVGVQIQIFEQGTNNPIVAYTPGNTYDMRVTLSHTAGNPVGFGFQLTALTAAAQPLMGFSNLASNVKQITLTSGPQTDRTYVEHNGVTLNNQFNFSFTAPSAGTGTVNFHASGNAVNGNNGSSGDTSGASSLFLPEAQPLAVSATSSDPSCADSNDGSIFLTVNTGVPPYTFNWTDGAQGDSRTNLPAGAYAVIITDAAGQTLQQSFTLIDPPAIVASSSVSDAILPGGEGSVTLNAQGGEPNYSFTIDGVGSVSTFPVILTAGTYSYTITDSQGCSVTDSFTIAAPAPLIADVAVTAVSCFGAADGSLELLSITGATPPYVLTWSTGGALSGLAPGEFTLTVVDAVDYSVDFTFEITEPDQLELNTDLEAIDCFGEQAALVVSASGGTGPYSGTGSFDLSPGTYDITVSDANGCSVTATVEVISPDPLEVEVVTPLLPCAGGEGSIDVFATGGAEPYLGTGSIDITLAGVYPIMVTDANGCQVLVNAVVEALDGPTIEASVEAPLCFESCDGAVGIMLDNATLPVTAVWSNGSETLDLQAVCQGTYTLNLTDSAGCQLQATYTVPGVAELVLAVLTTEPLCAGDPFDAIAIASGGTPAYEIEWSNGHVGESISGLPAGAFAATVTDANGCQRDVAFDVEEPDALVIESATVIDITETADGSIEINVVGGTPPYAYAWSTGGDAPLEDGLTDAGTYTVVVTDANGCSLEVNYDIAVVVSVAGHETEVLRVYPNPFTDRFTLRAPTLPEELHVYSSNGRIMYEVKPEMNEWSIDASAWPAGLYVMVVTTTGGRAVYRLLRQ